MTIGHTDSTSLKVRLMSTGVVVGVAEPLTDPHLSGAARRSVFPLEGLQIGLRESISG